MTRPLSQTLVRKFWGGLAIIVIAAALLVQLGRLLLPYADDQREFIADQLGQRLGLEVEIGRIEGQWQGLKPQLTIADMVWRNQRQEEVLRTASIYTQIDLLQSLFNWRLSWTDFSIHSLHLHLQQHDSGKLSLRGLNPGGDSTMGAVDPLRLLLTRGKIDFSEINASIYNSQGDFNTWRIPNVVAENTASFHRLTASIQVNGKPQAQFVLEGEGDPDDRETFLATAYLKLDEVEVSEIAAQFAGAKWQQFEQRQKLQGLALTGEFWLSMVPGGYMEISGTAKGYGGSKPLPEQFQLELSGDVSPQGQWQVNIQNINSQYQGGIQAPQLDIAISGGSDQNLALYLGSLDLGAWHRLAEVNGWIPEGRLQDLFSDLSPKGHLNNIKLDLGKDPAKDFLLSANLSQVSAGAWQGAPAVSQVDGYVQSGARRGFVELNSQQGFSMHYTTVYKDPQAFDSARGQVVWTLKPEDNAVYVNSGPIDLRKGDTQVRGFMHLYTPWKADTDPSELTLFIGMKNEEAGNHHKYVPFVVGAPLLDWLDQSIKGGQISEAGFIMRGGLDSRRGKSQSIQLAANIENAELKYLPDWQAVKQLNAQLILDGFELHSQIHSADVAGINIQSGEVSIVKVPEVPGSVIQIAADVTATGQQGLDFLHNSPLRSVIGDTMSEWQLGGDISGNIDLQFPLNKGEHRGQKQRVNIALDNNSLDMGNLNLPVKNLQGEISYHELSGLGAKKLQAQLWQRPLSIDISGKQGTTDINFKHQLKAESLALWLNSPELLMADGELVYQGKLHIPSKSSAKPVLLSIDSNLHGLAINLPAPYGKKHSESVPFKLRLPIAETNIFQLDYKNLNLVLEQSNIGVERVALAINQRAKLSQQKGFSIDGHIDQLNIQDWPQVFAVYQEAQQRLDGLKSQGEHQALVVDEKALPLNINLDISQLTLGKASLENAKAHAKQLGQDWLLSLSSELLAGELSYFADGSPVKITLDYLRLPEIPDKKNVESGQEPAPETKQAVTEDIQAQLLKDFDFSQVFAADVEVKEISLGKKQLGQWLFQLRPIDQGLELHNIKGQLGDLRIAGLSQIETGGENQSNPAEQPKQKEPEITEQGAFLRWTRVDGVEKTELSGLISTTDLNQLAKQWQMPSILESQAGRFEIAMQWQSNPLDIDQQTLTGDLSLLIKKGRFFQSTGAAGSAVLRLVSLFNFDTWVRRLRLDFSDLYKEGMVFDRVEGQLSFAEQKILIKDPIQVSTPSSKLQLAGVIDWKQESLDTHLVATLPVGNNITLATALLVNLPTAAGVYLVSKLFSDQVDKVASVSYSMTGAWDKPKVEFDKLFDSKAAKKAGEKVSQNKTPVEDKAQDKSQAAAKQAQEEPLVPKGQP